MKKSAANILRHIVLENNRLEFFILVCLLYLFSAVIINEYIIRDELFYRSLGNQLSINAIDELISFRTKWQWVGYAVTPVILAIKFLLVGTFLSMGSIVAGHRLTFRQLFAIAMVAELVYLAANFITTGNIMFSEINSLEDLNVSLLSVASLVSESTTEKYLYVPLQSLSIFLAIYVTFLAWSYKIVTGYSLRDSFVLILATYGTAFIMWNILIMYLLISYV